VVRTAPTRSAASASRSATCTVNTGRAGRTYPVKSHVRDQNRALVTSLAAVGSITYKKVACGEFSRVPTDLLETEATGGTSLRFEGDQLV
jgi:hypothetical protein